jgi:hypothetical protein
MVQTQLQNAVAMLNPNLKTLPPSYDDYSKATIKTLFIVLIVLAILWMEFTSLSISS